MRLRTIVILLLIGGAVFYWRDDLRQLFNDLRQSERFQTVQLAVSGLTERVLTATPLRGPLAARDTVLTRNGVLAQTNMQRQAQGLPQLAVDPELNTAAEIKVADMFARQYFEHESPTGEGPADVARAARYDFIIVGENLALGNYEDDADLVQAWMDSPGHRANILHERFTEIGVAVMKGEFEGKRVWMAVQEFGLPESACEALDEGAPTLIETNKLQLEQLEAELQQRNKELEKARRGNDRDEHERLRSEYNALVEQYNALVEATKEMVEKYNAEVRAFNECAAG